ncbi:MAG: class I SAM-dependent methyltransferase [Pseudomonadota bacterium]
MSDVRAQYEAYPYPPRDPAEEATRLITGSPSDPREIDHFLFGGGRDWSQPLTALFAGGGTGDGLIQLATLLAQAGRPYEITYLDLSTASRAVAEARAKARGLTGIRFETGSLLDAAEYGRFDYIDCCGVLHHLPDPAAGFEALAAACAPEGGLGFMVYAPYGRSGVYPLQEAFGLLLEGLSPQDRLARAKQIYDKLPDGHPIKCNPHLVDHQTSDAGFYDLLLHSQDQAFSVDRLLAMLDETGWGFAGFVEAAAYDPNRYAPQPDGLSAAQSMALAEKLNGTMKVHVGYARPQGAEPPRRSADAIPHLRGIAPAMLAKAIAQGKAIPIKRGGETVRVPLPKAAAPLIAGINGRRSVAEIMALAKMPAPEADRLWLAVDTALTGWGILLYSNLLKGMR